jgi:hypothetical protein
MTVRNRIIGFTMAGLLSVSFLALPQAAKASEEGRRNTALALGAATAYFIIRKRPIESLVGAGATAYAAKLLQDDINKRHRRERNAAVSSAYRSSYSSSGFRSSSSMSRARSSSGVSAASKQALVSSAFKKGMAAGFSNGYKKGMAKGYRAGANKARVSYIPNSSVSSTYSRIRAAQRS